MLFWYWLIKVAYAVGFKAWAVDTAAYLECCEVETPQDRKIQQKIEDFLLTQKAFGRCELCNWPKVPQEDHSICQIMLYEDPFIIDY